MATSYRTRLGPFQESYDQVYDAIQEEFKNVGFGVLTNVDVKAVFESKLNKTNEPRRHIIKVVKARAPAALSFHRVMWRTTSWLE